MREGNSTCQEKNLPGLNPVKVTPYLSPSFTLPSHTRSISVYWKSQSLVRPFVLRTIWKICLRKITSINRMLHNLPTLSSFLYNTNLIGFIILCRYRIPWPLYFTFFITMVSDPWVSSRLLDYVPRDFSRRRTNES